MSKIDGKLSKIRIRDCPKIIELFVFHLDFFYRQNMHESYPQLILDLVTKNEFGNGVEVFKMYCMFLWASFFRLMSNWNPEHHRHAFLSVVGESNLHFF